MTWCHAIALIPRLMLAHSETTKLKSTKLFVHNLMEQSTNLIPAKFSGHIVRCVCESCWMRLMVWTDGSWYSVKEVRVAFRENVQYMMPNHFQCLLILVNHFVMRSPLYCLALAPLYMRWCSFGRTGMRSLQRCLPLARTHPTMSVHLLVMNVQAS